MNKNIESYVRMYDGFLDKPFCERTVALLQNEQWQRHEYYDVKTDQTKSYEDDLFVSNGKTLTETEHIEKNIWFVLQRYITDLQLSWFLGWNGYLPIRYNQYRVNTRMRIHCDHIHSMFDGNRKGIPILSIVGALNEDYEGGEFVFWNDRPLKIPTGSVIVFPSNFLYPHEVLPVTKGTRNTYVSWVW